MDIIRTSYRDLGALKKVCVLLRVKSVQYIDRYTVLKWKSHQVTPSWNTVSLGRGPSQQTYHQQFYKYEHLDMAHRCAGWSGLRGRAVTYDKCSIQTEIEDTHFASSKDLLTVTPFRGQQWERECFPSLSASVVWCTLRDQLQQLMGGWWPV